MARRTINGCRVLVTGASSGIGAALVQELLDRGARVVALARRADRLASLAAGQATGDHYRWHAGDVTNRSDRAAALELAVREFGGLDALINNAGIGALGAFADADEARLRKLFEVNLFAPAELIREALPLLRQGNRPIVVNMGSVLGHRAVPGKSEYCASKFALHGLSDALRAEFAREKIDLLLVSPSTTATEFFDVAAAQSFAFSPARNPLGSMTPRAVARRTVAAMAAGRHEIILSTGGKMLVWLDRLCPALAHWFVTRWT